MLKLRQLLIIVFKVENNGENILLVLEKEAQEMPKTDAAEARATVQLNWERNMKLT